MWIFTVNNATVIKAVLPKFLERRIVFMYRLYAADVTIISFPKSGRTWLRMMITNYYKSLYNINDVEIIEFGNMNKKNVTIPKINFTHKLNKFIISQILASEKYLNNSKKIIFLIRDPRDILVSFYFERRFRQETFKGGIEDFIYDKEGGIATIVRYLNNVANLSHKNDKILYVKYEDLVHNTNLLFIRILNFMGEHITDQSKKGAVTESIRKSSFDNMHAMEAGDVFLNPRIRAKNTSNPESFKVRRGKVGGYVDYISGSSLNYINEYISKNLDPSLKY